MQDVHKYTVYDLGDLFAATPTGTSLRSQLALESLQMNLHGGDRCLCLADVGQAFVHADIDEDIFVWLPPECADTIIEVA